MWSGISPSMISTCLYSHNPLNINPIFPRSFPYIAFLRCFFVYDKLFCPSGHNLLWFPSAVALPILSITKDAFLFLIVAITFSPSTSLAYGCPVNKKKRPKKSDAFSVIWLIVPCHCVIFQALPYFATTSRIFSPRAKASRESSSR